MVWFGKFDFKRRDSDDFMVLSGIDAAGLDSVFVNANTKIPLRINKPKASLFSILQMVLVTSSFVGSVFRL